jgi:putative PIN family toxin of toxin-antitoxin system
MPNSKPIKVIIDTNLWISFLIGKQLGGLKELLIAQKIQPIFSQQLLDEINLVTQRPKLHKYFPLDKVQELINFLKIIGLLVEIKSEVSICRDSKDNYLLALAQDSGADYLVTGDQDLLSLNSFATTEIVTYQEFLIKINHNRFP